MNALIEFYQKVDCLLLSTIGLHIVLQQRPVFSQSKVRRELCFYVWRILEGKLLRIWLKKEIKRIDDCHIRHKIHFKGKNTGFFRKNKPSLKISERILLPVQKVFFGMDIQGIA